MLPDHIEHLATLTSSAIPISITRAADPQAAQTISNKRDAFDFVTSIRVFTAETPAIFDAYVRHANLFSTVTTKLSCYPYIFDRVGKFHPDFEFSNGQPADEESLSLGSSSSQQNDG